MTTLIAAASAVVATIAGAYLFWRYYWFWRNPPRTHPPGDGVLSPADGTVVYVKTLTSDEDVVVDKKGSRSRICDILREELEGRRVLIGIFMSPFGVHYNRAPISAEVKRISHYPAKTRNLHMTSMHWRTILRMLPFYANSPHVVENERTVTLFEGVLAGAARPCYVVQIAGGSVCGIDSYFAPGQTVARGEVFGMIRIGSQVDIVLPEMDNFEVRVRPGDFVRAGETVIVDRVPEPE